MKSKLLALALLLAMGSAASARVNWQGEVMVLGVSPGCSGKVVIGDHFLSLYHPSALSNNGPDAFLSFFTRRAAFSLRVAAGNPAASANYTLIGFSSRGHRTSGQGKFVTFNTNPATVTGATPIVVVNAKIGNFLGFVGCAANIRGAYVQHRETP